MPLLDALGPEDSKILEGYLETVSFAKDSCIFAQGDPGTECYMLDRGRIRLELTVSESGMTATLGFLESGHILGEFCLLEEGLRSAAAYAEEDVTARRLSRENFTTLCREHPELGIEMLAGFSRELIRKTRSTNDQLEEFLSKVLEHYPGLLFVLDSAGAVGSHISGRVRELFGNVQGKELADVLYADDAEAAGSFRSVLELALSDETTCAAFMKDLTESLICIDGVSFDLNYYVTSSHDEQVDSMLVLGKDVTQQLAEKRKADEASREAQLITSIARDVQGFLAFHKEAVNILELLQADDLVVDRGSIDSLFRGIHTVKGAAGAYSLYQVQALAHDLETHLAGMRDRFRKDAGVRIEDGERDEIKQRIMDLGGVLADEHTRLCELFQLKGSVVRVSSEQLRDVIERNLPPEEAFAYLSLPTFEEFVRNFSEKILEGAHAALAEEGKAVGVSVSVGSEKLSHEGRALLEKVLSHLLRNAADHGIEESIEREMLKKTPHGNIVVEQKDNDGDSVTLIVRDDGKGIDTKTVLEKAKKKGVVKDRAPSDEKDIYELLFHPGFSTKGSVTTISGRGVGLDAVRDFLRVVNGSITVDSVELKGTTFTMTIPEKALFYKSRG